MTVLYISEYANMPTQAGGLAIQAGSEPALVVQTPLSYGGGHQESAAFNASTRFVRLHTDAICSVHFSTAGTAATTNDARMAANQTEFFGVNGGDKVSVITNT